MYSPSVHRLFFHTCSSIKSVSYGSGSFSGTECACCLSLAFGATPMQQHLIVLPDTDQVTLSPSLIIESQSIGVASTAQGFSGVDGILGYRHFFLIKRSIISLTLSHYAVLVQLTSLKALLEKTRLY